MRDSFAASASSSCSLLQRRRGETFGCAYDDVSMQIEQDDLQDYWLEGNSVSRRETTIDWGKM